MKHANLSNADLREIEAQDANLHGADLHGARLNGARLDGANLRGANLRGASLCGAHLYAADLRNANLRETDLCGADLRCADLCGADLRGAILFGANLCFTELSETIGLPTAADWGGMQEADEEGIIVYKALFPARTQWAIEPGSVITETVNPDRCADSGSGVQVAPYWWVRKHYPRLAAWRCRIAWIDLADLVVPYGTDGPARCGRVTLLGKVAR